ncbi:MAG: AAA family ATPase, partial [Anaerolineales bacterium]|nr:AAA family ATPase [Anaerolineales bacterium]
MPSLSVSVLGPLHVALADAPVAAVGYSKVRALLAYLAVEAGRPHPRAELCALLWPDRPEAAARRNLTQALTALRRTLGEAWLLAGPEVVRLNPERDLIVDAARFGALLDTAERHAHRSWPTCRPCADRLEAALALYRGDFLAQFFLPDSAPFEEWALLWRERLRQRAFSALERLAQRAEWCGAFSQAAAYAQRLAALDPLREASQREAMRLLALDGQLAAAEAQYEHLRRTLADELAVQPEPETRRLHERLRAGPPAALRRLAAPPVNGPLPPNALVGRAADVPAVCAQLRADGVRALTITGPPGLGKTRLALEAAQALRFDFEDGVHVVELAPAADAEQVLPAIAQVLGVKEPANGGALAAALSAWLQPRQVLLVLDNFEHVLAAAARVADLLAAGPGLKVLVTSRAPLRLRAEQQYALAPLPAADAVRLFGERARAVQPAFALTAANADALAELCARVDHLPLAIELLAGRARTFSPAELLRQLEQPLDALAHGARDLPARHRSLREALSWSYDRLTAEEQRAFAHLGVFVGGWTAEAALSVAGAAPAILEALSEASLVQAEAPAEETRFGLLETVREFALEQLAARGAAPEARQRHAAYYLRLAERARPELDGPDQVRWFDRLEREHANLRAALAWGLAHDRALGLGLAWAAARFWSVRGYLGEGRRWLQELLQPGAAVPPGLEARALAAASRLASLQGEYRAALELAGRSEAVSLRQEDAGGVALAGLAAGVAHNGLGE